MKIDYFKFATRIPLPLIAGLVIGTIFPWGYGLVLGFGLMMINLSISIEQDVQPKVKI